jgi:hypothetical protein
MDIYHPRHGWKNEIPQSVLDSFLKKAQGARHKVQGFQNDSHVFIRLRQNTLRLVVAKRKSRLRGRGDEWRGEPRRSSKSEGGSAMAQFRLIPHRLRWGASLTLRHAPCA